MKRLARWIDKSNKWVGRTTCVLILLLTAFVVYQVFRRYVLRAPTIWEFESATYLYGILFMLGAGYTHLQNGHVAIDILEQRLSRRKRAVLALAASLVLFFPFLAIMTWQSIDFALTSWSTTEHSATTWGPPIYPIKTIMPIGFALLALQGMSRFIKDLSVALDREEGRADTES
jgi:TRAP-type mannitol/chloroaromatic compound transport system permease small subunit